jgi:hypothetical protein
MVVFQSCIRSESESVSNEATVLLLQGEGPVIDGEAEGRKALVEETPSGQGAVSLDRLRQQVVENIVSGQRLAIAVKTGSAVDGHCELLIE